MNRRGVAQQAMEGKGKTRTDISNSRFCLIVFDLALINVSV